MQRQKMLKKIMTIDLAENLVLLSVHIEISHTLATQSVLQCLSNILGTNSHDTGLVTVNLNTGFRLTELQVYVCLLYTSEYHLSGSRSESEKCRDNP